MRLPAWLTNQDSVAWPAISRVSSIFGLIAPIAAIVTFIATNNFTVPALIIAIYLCVLVTTLTALLIRQERRYLREARYAPALLPLRRAYSEVARSSFGLYYGDRSQEAFRLGLQESLRRLAEAFTLITGTQCRACIKVIQAPSTSPAGDDILVSTLCRGNEDVGAPRHAPDRVGDNTDFRQIFADNRSHFFSNNLPGDLSRGYKNSHWNERDIQDGTVDYRATIVWPIERGPISRLDHDVPREIIGFLCVDTQSTGVFLESYDVALGASFAQALYLALHRLRELVTPNDSQTTTREGD